MVGFSVKFVAVCERVLGTICALYAIGGFGFLVVSNKPSRGAAISLAIAALLMMGGPAIVCIKSANAIIRGARWAWFVSFAIGLFIAVLGLCIVTLPLSSEGAPEIGKAFGIGFGSLFLAPSVTGLVLLNLPRTRRFVFQTNEDKG